ncbi:hypothetical protein GJ496_003563, partial [Pomphorhynchus laevis]
MFYGKSVRIPYFIKRSLTLLTENEQRQLTKSINWIKQLNELHQSGKVNLLSAKAQQTYSKQIETLEEYDCVLKVTDPISDSSTYHALKAEKIELSRIFVSNTMK